MPFEYSMYGSTKSHVAATVPASVHFAISHPLLHMMIPIKREENSDSHSFTSSTAKANGNYSIHTFWESPPFNTHKFWGDPITPAGL